MVKNIFSSEGFFRDGLAIFISYVIESNNPKSHGQVLNKKSSQEQIQVVCV